MDILDAINIYVFVYKYLCPETSEINFNHLFYLTQYIQNITILT
jgi:hypothetical protein